MANRFALFAVCLFLLSALTTSAQNPPANFTTFNPRFEVFTLPGGDLANQVQDIVQDSTGYLWFGTAAGLIRYNGQSFRTWRHDPLNPNSLSGDLIDDIFLDSKGVLWLAHWTSGGVTSFDPEREIFTRYEHDPNNPESPGSATISVFAEDQDGNIWMGGQSGLDRLNRRTGKFTHFRNDPTNPRSLSHDQVRALYVDKQGTLWIGTGTPWDPEDRQHKLGGLNRFDPKTETFTCYLHDPTDQQSLANNKVRAIFEDSRGSLWVGTAGDGLQRLDRKTGKFERLFFDPKQPEKLSRPYLRNLSPAAHIPESHVTSISEDAKGRIWITAYPGGLNVFDPSSGTTRHFEMGKKEGDLTTNHLWKTLHSRDGTTWIGCAGTGRTVFKVKQQDSMFPFYPVPGPPKVPDWFSHGILKDRAGRVWVAQVKSEAMPARLLRMNRQTGEMLEVSLGDSVNAIFSLTLNRDGKLWVGTNMGQYRGDPETAVFQPFRMKGIAADVVKNLFAPVLYDRSGRYWFSGLNGAGLVRHDPKTGGFTHFKNDPDNPGSLTGNFTFGLYEDAKGNVWVGGGSPFGDASQWAFLDRFNPSINAFEHFWKASHVSCVGYVTGDEAGNIWFAEGQGGLLKLDPSTGKLTHFNPENSSLPTRDPYSLTWSRDGKLWLSSEKALIEFNPETETMSVFDEKRGIRNANGFFLSGSVAEDGELFFIREGGFHAFYPKQLQREKDLRKPVIRITGFRLLGEPVTPGGSLFLEKPIWQTSSLQLAHHQNVFSFSVACFDFRDPAADQLQFKLEGFDRGWRKDLHDGETPPYINVPPGEYTFRLRGANSLGIWNMEGASLKIRILPPWWKTWWAYLSYGLLTVLGIYFLDRNERRRIVQKERRKMLEKEVAHAKEIEKAYADLKAAQVQLVQSEKLASLGELTAGIAHEIQNPLNFVNNFSELSVELAKELNEELDKATIDKGLVKELMDDLTSNQEKINFHGKRASSIVTGMLQHARTSTGKKEPTDLNALADEYLRLAYHGLRAKDSSFNAKMETDFDPAIEKVDVVPQDIGRVFLNLLNNAFYATQQRKKQVAEDLLGFKNLTGLDSYEPTVSVSSKKTAGGVEFRFRDNGTGIPEAVKAKIFQPFFTTKPTGQGTGLGLSLAYDIVTKGHGGTLEVETKEGVGTEFVVRLPAVT